MVSHFGVVSISVAIGLAGAATTAFADEPEDKEELVKRRRVYGAPGDGNAEQPSAEEKPKKVVVIKKKDRGPAPEVGDHPSEIEDYLRELKDRTRDLKDRMKAARRAGDYDEAESIRQELAEEQSFYDRERDRLTERNTGLIAGGATLTALGGASFLASIFLVIGYGLSAIDSDANDTLGWSSLACLFGGAAGVGGGGAMLGVGLVRRPKEVAGTWMMPAFGSAPPAPGLTLTWQF
jgi:hypothetical protein